MVAFYGNGTRLIGNSWPGDETYDMPREIAVGDLDNDGFENDFAVGDQQNIIHVFDETGKEVWKNNVKYCRNFWK